MNKKQLNNKNTDINNNSSNEEINLLQKFFYSNLEKNFFKRLLIKIFVSRFFSFFISLYLKSFISKIHIKKTIKKNNINLELLEKKSFCSYNDFFVRKYKKIFFAKEPHFFISPSEGEISIYSISENSFFLIKGTRYHLSDLLKDEKLSSEYNNGFAVVLRLKPYNYHRYIFIDDGFVTKNVKIKGKLHTVHPIVFKYFNVFKENNREYSILETKNFKKIVQIEIGALLVGKIHNHSILNFRKGQEKGFFSFGGSMIVLLIKFGLVDFNKKILINTQNKLETSFLLGQSIGVKKNF
ncbi:phosphatidylserine decarboxylase [Candidatus Phytoplasma pini]|uniref:Phosphatidylserine decarboxylase n=1 Tax=Candidatus Phytoplasma pini TaxID=267362 RepID=A0A559KJU4_9MOLU|nr:phosphatidylserine decarboxylase [Candidatus Phytoplasma pini]TVY12377.1 Phosphatidylserine decarboxylase [Candidatus Phytoplasma pini]